MVTKKKTAKKKPVAKKTPKKKYQKISEEIIEEIRQLYVHGTEDATGKRVHPSVATLSKSFGIKDSLIKARVTKGRWLDQRAVFQAKVQTDIDKKKRKEISDQAVTFDSSSLTIAKGIQNEIIHLMNAAASDREAAVGEKVRLQLIADNEDGPPDQDGARPKKLTTPERKYLLYEFKSFTPHALMGMAQALATAQRVGRLAFGESTENTNVSNTGPEPVKDDAAAAFEFLDELIARRTKADTGNASKVSGSGTTGTSGGVSKLH